MLNFKDIELKLQLEKMVIGLEEPILIKGGGKFIAKVDSGNAGYNVIHGEDLVQQGDILNFKTFDSDNNERRISKKIVDTLNVHIGAGNIQERPVIELDIKFADEDYKKVPFTVTDRSKNSEKVLISKDFVQNQLDALIDVSQVNMTEKEPVEVDYVNEGLSGFLNNIAHGSDTEWPWDQFGSGSSNGNGNGGGNGSNSKEKNGYIAALPAHIKNDAELIRAKINSNKDSIDANVFGNSKSKDISCVNFDIKRVLDYENNLMYGKKLNVKNSLINNSYIEKWSNRYNLVNENLQDNTNTSTQNANNGSEEQKVKNEKSKTGEFCIYFCGGTCDGKKVISKGIENMFKEAGSYQNISKTFLEGGVFNNNSFEKYCSNIIKNLKVTNSYSINGVCGLFAVCTGEIKNRNVFFCKNILEFNNKK